MKKEHKATLERCVAYIDLLGFSNYVLKDHINNDDAAAHMLQELIRTLRTKYCDTLSKPISSYNDPVSAEIAADDSVDDFEAFLPLSDGIFITGYCPAKTLPQIARFLCNCFSNYAAQFDRNGKDPAELTEIEITILKLDGTSTKRKTYAHPILFRGGASFGHVDYMDSSFLYRNPYPSYNDHNDPGSGAPLYHFVNLLGKSVLDAVSFDKSKLCSGTGPRFYIHDTLYDRLVAQNAKNVLDFIEIETKKDEKGRDVFLRYLLWPAFSMIITNSFDLEFINNFCSVLDHAVALWIAYKNVSNDQAGQYLSLVEMCFDAYRAFGIATKETKDKNGMSDQAKAEEQLRSYIDKHVEGASNKEVLCDILHKDLRLAGQLYK